MPEMEPEIDIETDIKTEIKTDATTFNNYQADSKEKKSTFTKKI